MANLVEILAREWKNWPIEPWLPISQNEEGCLFVSCRFTEDGATRTLGIEVELSDDLSDDVTRTQWEAERARIAANQQATDEAREIAQAGTMTNEEQELSDIACGKRSKEDQALWDEVAIVAMRAYMAQPKTIGDVVVEEFVGWGVEVADAFMAERAKRLGNSHTTGSTT